jgi:hypothetical protein
LIRRTWRNGCRPRSVQISRHVTDISKSWRTLSLPRVLGGNGKCFCADLVPDLCWGGIHQVGKVSRGKTETIFFNQCWKNVAHLFLLPKHLLEFKGILKYTSGNSRYLYESSVFVFSVTAMSFQQVT